MVYAKVMIGNSIKMESNQNIERPPQMENEEYYDSVLGR
jgi:hypothetical protein